MRENDQFVIRINTSNAAFVDAGETNEVARILRALADKFEGTPHLYDGNLRDANGNTVGQFYVSENEGKV